MVFATRQLPAGVHRELGIADVDRRDAQQMGRDRADRSARRDIIARDKLLPRDFVVLTDACN